MFKNFLSCYIKKGGAEILKALEPRFNKNSAFVFALLQLCFQERVTLRENRILKDKLEKISEIVKA